MRGVWSEYRYSGSAAVAPSQAAREKRPDCSRAPPSGRDVVPSARAVELATTAQKDPRVVELILRESTSVLRCRAGVNIVEHRLGLVMANAGIDASNVDGAEGDERVLLLPENPDRSAAVRR